jgi:hypothetical protein
LLRHPPEISGEFSHLADRTEKFPNRIEHGTRIQNTALLCDDIVDAREDERAWGDLTC